MHQWRSFRQIRLYLKPSLIANIWIYIIIELRLSSRPSRRPGMSLLIKEPSILFLYCSLVEIEQAMRKYKLKGSFVSCVTISIASFFHGSLIINATELEAVNYYHKELHLECCSSPRATSNNLLYNVWGFIKISNQK